MEVTISDSSAESGKEKEESPPPLVPIVQETPQEQAQETQVAVMVGQIQQSLLQVKEAQETQAKAILEARKENLETHNLVQSLGEAIETFLNEEGTEEDVSVSAVSVDVKQPEQKPQEAPVKPPGIIRKVFLGR